VNIPLNTFLSPSDTAAVVGGNVLTSQRVTDVILAAFGAQVLDKKEEMGVREKEKGGRREEGKG